jgi:hypothetical protein
VTTTLEKMMAPEFDLHARLKSTGWIVIQSAFNSQAVNHTGIMDRVAKQAEGTFDEITNDRVDMNGVGS